MRTEIDAVLSVKKYLAQMLGDAWEVRLIDEAGEFAYPFARVEDVGPASYSGSAFFDDVTLPLAVQAYQAPQESADQSWVQAANTRESLWKTFRQGGRHRGHPSRVPLYDFSGKTLGQTSDTRFDHDYLRVVDYSDQVLTSPEDDRLCWVAANLRVTWRRPARLRSVGPIVQEVRLRTTPD